MERRKFVGPRTSNVGSVDDDYIRDKEADDSIRSDDSNILKTSAAKSMKKLNDV